MKQKGKIGKDHWNWKGGKTVHPSGHVLINVTGNPLAKGKYQMLEHRYVMAKHLGRTLSSSECIHHINGIKTDNRIENLQILTAAEHAIIHHKKGEKFSKRWIACMYCGSIYYCRKTRFGYSKYCSQKCANIGRTGIRTTPIRKRKCPHCKKRFEPIFNSEPSKFCSITCANKSRASFLIERTCFYCNKRFYPCTHRNSSKQRFCSISCGVKNRHR